MKKISINMASKQFEENLINLINQSGLPEVNIVFILSNMMEMAKSELGRKIAEEERRINEDIAERN